MNNLKRPHIFINELQLYVDYILKELERAAGEVYDKHVQQLEKIKSNILEGIIYYKNLFASKEFKEYGFAESALVELERCKSALSALLVFWSETYSYKECAPEGVVKLEFRIAILQKKNLSGETDTGHFVW